MNPTYTTYMVRYLYGDTTVDLAISRGWDAGAHTDALAEGNEDEIALTHPFNHLTESEVEAWEAARP